MASSTEDQSKPAGTDHPQPPEPVIGHPPITGYPPTQAAGYPPVYPGYHPYTVPPPSSYYNNTNQPYPSQPHNYRRNGFCRGFMVTLVALIIISTGISFIVWLVLRPQVPQFRIESLALSNFNLSLSNNSKLTATWDVGVTSRNPNKKLNVLYEILETSVLYKTNILGTTLLEPFSVAKRDQETVHGKVARDSEYLDELVAKDMDGDRIRGAVSFSVRMIVSARFKAGNWLTRHRSMKVFCENLKVAFLNATVEAGTLMGAPNDCLVYL